MASNFWQSSHYQQWILEKSDLIRGRKYDFKFLTESEYQKLFIFFANFTQSLGEHLKLRQQVIATSIVYFKRFYARNSLKDIDPFLLVPTCILLSSKVEEFGVIVKDLMAMCKKVIKDKFSYMFSQAFPYNPNHVIDCEFYLLENLDCCLIVYQPYRILEPLIADINGNPKIDQNDQLLNLTWRIINDLLRTDVSLLYPPHQIAIGCLQLACVILQKDLTIWFAELDVDIEKIQEIVRAILNLYELWKDYNEKTEIQSLLLKVPKPKPAS